jgi:hypothetical protein
VTTDEHPVFPPGRYGRQRTPHRIPRPLAVAGIAALVAIMAFIGFRLYRAYGDQDYSAAVTSFTTAEGSVDVEFIVRLPADGNAKCVVRARDLAGAEIGRATVDVAAGPQPNRTVVTYRLVTTGRPVTGEVVGCSPASASSKAETSR